MAKVVLYGIPTCGTVKKTQKFLEARGVDHDVVNMREKAPSAAQVKRWVKALGAKALRNTSGGAYRALGPEKAEWSDAEWTAAFQDDAMLIKRPVIEVDKTPVSVGFKEDILKRL